MDSTSHTVKRIVIIGGGISGLAAAHRIEEIRKQTNAQIEYLLLESSDRLGGIIKTHTRDGFLLEAGPDSFISEKPEVIELASRLDLSNNLIETNAAHRRSFIVRNGRLRPVPEGFHLLAPSRFLPFVTTDIFSWPGKLRMALDLIIPQKRNPNGSDDESLAAFVRRRLGNEALERMAQPMVGGIYTADPEKLSLRATMPRFLDMEKSHGSVIRAMWKERRNPKTPDDKGTSGPRYSLFLSFDSGMQLIVDRLRERLSADSIRLKTVVDSIARNRMGREWTVRIQSGHAIEADAICLAIPSYHAATLLTNIDGVLARELESIRYASTATINLAFGRTSIAHPLNGFGFVVPQIERKSLIACSFSSVKFANRAPDDCVLLRAFVGGDLQPEMFALDDDEMLARVLGDLGELLRINGAPLFSLIERWPRSMAQYHIGHLNKIESIKRRLDAFETLRLAGNAYDGAGLPDCVRSGETAAENILSAIVRD